MSTQTTKAYDPTQHAFIDMTTREVITPNVNFDGSAYSGNPNTPVSTVPSSPTAIVTSNQSRANYTQNVDTMNKANESLRQVQAGQTASGIAASLGMTPEQFLKINPDFAARGGNRDYQGLTGDIKPGQTYKISADGTPEIVPEPKGEIKTNADGTTTTTNPDGTTVVKNLDGTETQNNPDGTSSTIDPTLRKLFDENIASLTASATTAKTVMDSAIATLNDDPAAAAAAESIKNQYNTLINQMKEKNNMLLGSYGKNSSRTGMLQYANEMDTNFKSMEFDKAVMRVADLEQKKNEAIAKSNAAYKSGNLKALKEATDEYNNVLKEKGKEILELNKAITEAVKLGQADLKIKQTELKQQITDDIRLSAALGKTLADAISKSGVTDPNKIDAYITAMAEANGISNPDILKSSLVKEQQALSALNLKNENTQSIIDKRERTPVGGGGTKGTQTEREADAVSSFSNAFVPGATLKDGTPIIDSNGYITPVVWKQAIKDAPSKGLTRAKFIKEFGSMIYTDEKGKIPSDYGLTAVEKKIITGK